MSQMIFDNCQRLLKYFRSKYDQSKINNHESLTFVYKNYKKNPADILTVILVGLIIVILAIQRLRILTILMCYVLPTLLMISNICQSMQKQKTQPFQQQKAQKQLQKQQKQVMESELTQQQSNLTQDIKETSQNDPLIVQNKKIANTDSNQLIGRDKICKVFIMFFMFNLIIDLMEPVILLTVQYLFNLVTAILNDLGLLVWEGDVWSLVLMPFQIVLQFFVTAFRPFQISIISQIIWIIVRISICAKALYMNDKIQEIFNQIFQQSAFIKQVSQSKHLKNQ